jgi:hypothetical protein
LAQRFVVGDSVCVGDLANASLDVSMEKDRLVITPLTDSDRRAVARWYELLTRTPGAYVGCEFVEYDHAVILHAVDPRRERARRLESLQKQGTVLTAAQTVAFLDGTPLEVICPAAARRPSAPIKLESGTLLSKTTRKSLFWAR